MAPPPGNASPPGNAPPPAGALDWERAARDGATALILVRHGRTAWNAEKRFLGKTDVPLDEEGRAQAAAVAVALREVPLAAVWSSPLSRAFETARAIANGRGIDVLSAAELAELDQGELEGQPGVELLARHPAFLQQWLTDPEHARVPGGETLGECRTRAMAALARIAAAHPAAVVAVVTHQMVIASVLCAASGEALAEWRRFAVAPGTAMVASWSRSGISVG